MNWNSYSKGATVGAMCEAAHKRAPAFVAGYVRGVTCSFEVTDREIQEAYPEYSAAERTAYVNGFLDGKAGDTFRLSQLATVKVKEEQ